MADRFDHKRRKLQKGEYEEWIEKRQLWRYKYRYTDSKGKSQTIYSYTLTKNDPIPRGVSQKYGDSLREQEARIQQSIIEGIDNSKGNMSMYDLVKYYIEVKTPDVKPTTLSGYKTVEKFLSTEEFAKQKIQDITEPEAQLWFDSLHTKRKKNYSTLRVLRGVLRPAFTMARKAMWIRQPNPFGFEMLQKRYGKVKEREALSRADMRRFLDFVCEDSHFSRYAYGFMILFGTGLRISEFCGLTISDVDLDKKILHINHQLHRVRNRMYIEDSTKTKAGARDIPLNDDMVECFRHVIQNRPQMVKEPVMKSEDGKEYTGFLWFDKNGNLEVAQHWENHFRWAVKKFNSIYKKELPSVTPHIARHTYCSNMASAGMNPKVLQKLMGHASLDITMDVYTHINIDDYNLLEMVNNKQYRFYKMSKLPVESADDTDEDEPEMMDFEENDTDD